MGETYDDVLRKLYEQSIEHMMAKKLLDTTDSTEIEKILKKRTNKIYRHVR